MENTFEGWRVTLNCGTDYSFGHNLRLPGFVEKQKHIDPNGKHEVILHLGNEHEAYQKVFGEAIKKYNSKQKRKDRKITDYYQKILGDNRKGTHKDPTANPERKPFYEFQFYLGNRDSHCPNELARKILLSYIQKVMPKKFPNFVPVSIAIHNDEYSPDRKGNRIDSPLHIHVVGIYIAHALNEKELAQEKAYREKCKVAAKAELESKGIKWDEAEWKKKDWRRGMIERWGKSLEKGMELQSSMSAACNEMGFFTEMGKGTAQQQFEEAVRFDLMDFAETFGIKVNRNPGYKHSHREKEIYAAEQDNFEKEKELSEKEKVLEAEKIKLENRKDDFDYTIEHLEEISKDVKLRLELIESREKEFEKKNQQLEKDKAEFENQKESVEKKIKELEQKDSQQKTKDEQLVKKEKSLDERDEIIEKNEAKLAEREERVKTSEAPLAKREIEVGKRETDVSIRENKASEKESELSNLENDLKVREHQVQEDKKTAEDKLNEAAEKEFLAKSELDEAEKIKQENKTQNQNIQNLLEENRNLIDEFNFGSHEKMQKIDGWEEAAKEITDSENWIKPCFEEYQNDRKTSKPNSLQNLFHKIKKGVTGVIAKVKKSYDEKLDKMNKTLFGFRRIITKFNKVKNNDEVLCEYLYGEKDFADMLRDTPVSEIEKAIAETRQKGKATFAQAAETEKGYDFYDRYFTKAKELTCEREIAIERERNRNRSIER